MSHIATVGKSINNLNALDRACEALGAQLLLDQHTYKTYQGKNSCDHAIKVKNNNKAYEIGLIQTKDKSQYEMKSDFFMGGYGLEAVVGDNCCKLNQAYQQQVTMETMSAFSLNEFYNENGDLVMELTR